MHPPTRCEQAQNHAKLRFISLIFCPPTLKKCNFNVFLYNSAQKRGVLCHNPPPTPLSETDAMWGSEVEGAFHGFDVGYCEGTHLLCVGRRHAAFGVVDINLVQEMSHLSGVAPFLLVTMFVELGN